MKLLLRASLLFLAFALCLSSFASSGTATAGQSVTFSVTVNGTAPFTYQWMKESVPIPGATSAAYTLPSVVAANAGTYSVLVANSAGSTTSDNAVLTVNDITTITTGPANQAVVLGKPATFTVVAGGSGPFTYQWMKNGTNIAGATSATYSIASVAASDAGSYAVRVNGASGFAISLGAALTISTVPPSGATVTIQVGSP